MTLDLPFSMDPDPIQYEINCQACEDTGAVEYGDRLIPCPECRPDDHGYTISVGAIEP